MKDDKDWTWVLDRPCPECGFDASAPQDVPGVIRDNAVSWRGVVHRTERPDGQTWSPLEYACHVRDVHVLFGQRLQLMLTEDDPLFPNWDQDASATGYRTEQPDVVAGELEAAAENLASAFAGLTEEQWQRPARRSDGASFTVESFGRYLLHDLEHHRWDVRDAAPHDVARFAHDAAGAPGEQAHS
jgi:hypothetical protein